MTKYTDDSPNFKLIQAADAAGISRRNIGIFAMWLTGRGIPEHLHEFTTAIFVAGSWDHHDGMEPITLAKMARAISPGEDVTRSIEKAYNRLKKAAPRFFEWQSHQSSEVIRREIINYKTHTGKTKALYGFPDYKILARLFNLPLNCDEKTVRAAVARALQAHPLPVPMPRKPRKRKLESAKKLNAKTMLEVLDLSTSPEIAGVELGEAWEKVLNRETIEKLKRGI